MAVESPSQTDPAHLLAPASDRIISACQFRHDLDLHPRLLLKDDLKQQRAARPGSHVA